MKKAFYQGERHFMGFCPDYMWKAVSYFGAPKKSGRYLVIKKDGSIKELYCTGSHESVDSAQKLFKIAADTGYSSDSYIDDRIMTDEDLMNLYRSPWGWWYEFNEWYEYEDCHNDLYVYTKDSEEYPLYFLDLNLDEKIELDENGEIVGADGVKYFKYNLDGNLIEEEEK